MGAYYEATINRERFCTHDCDNGLKLMEHSYLENDYVARIMSMLIDKPAQLQWLCDYTEPASTDDNDTWTWKNTDEAPYMNGRSKYIDMKYFVINHDKGLYIDILKLHYLYEQEDESTWKIHPVPILCNSEPHSMGGGDYHKEDSRRSIWKGDTIDVTFDRKKVLGLKDITEYCLFYE